MKFFLPFTIIASFWLFYELQVWEDQKLASRQARIDMVEQQNPHLRPGAIYCISGDTDFKVIFRRFIDPSLGISNGRVDTARVTNQQGIYTYAVPSELKECK